MNKRALRARLGRMTAAERARGRYMRAPDHGDGGAGGDGGAAALLGGGAPDGEDQGGASGGDAAGAGGGAGGDPWYGGSSDQAPGEGQLSNRAWLENKKYADLDTLVSSARSWEGRFLAGDKVVMPKDGDPPEAFDNYYKSIGRPDSAEGYEFSVPEGRELDDAFAGRMRDAAFKAGVPKAMMGPLTEAFNAHIVEMEQNAEAQAAEAKRAGVAEVKSEWGDRFNTNIAHANKAMRMLELDADAIGQIENGLGTAKTLKLLARLGAGMGEDALIGGGSAGSFSVSPAEARAELAAMNKDADKRAKIVAKDPALTARRAMLIQVVAKDDERQRMG